MRAAARLVPVLAVVLLGAACADAAGTAVGATGKSRAPARRATLSPANDLQFGKPEALAAGTALASVSCGSPTSCIALDAEGRAYRFDGTRWSGPTVIGDVEVGPGAISVSCAGPTTCVADPAGGGQIWAWGGGGWSGPATLSGAGLEAVGCAPSGYCAAVDAEGNAFALEDGSWVSTAGDWGSVSAISCVSTAFCTSTSGGLSQWNGEEWTPPTTLGIASPFTGVSCPTASFCMAVDAVGQAVEWNGTAWSSPVSVEPAPQATSTGDGPQLEGVSCPSSSLCVVVDSRGREATWRGGRWSLEDVDGSRALSGVSCPSASLCVAVDRSGHALVGTTVTMSPTSRRSGRRTG